MHGRIKTYSTEEQKLQKQKKQQKQLLAYQTGLDQILTTRSKEDYDPASLSICTQLLTGNPDVYTLWNYRKEVILIEIERSKADETDGEEKLIKFLENEIQLTAQCLYSNPKSYGAWHHRYWVLVRHPKPNWQKEFELCTMYLSVDDRNFHCWDFRRLIVNKIGITLAEDLEFSLERLNENFSNYSSWHYRSTLRKLDEESVGLELTLVQNAVFTDPADSSAWFYLRWVLSNPSVSKEAKEELMVALEQLEEMEPDCKWIILAKCWLTGSLVLSDKNYADKRVEFYKRLEVLDPMHKGEYRDYLKTAQEKVGGAKDVD